MRSSLGRPSVISRWNRARYKRDKRDCNLNKTHFFLFGVLISHPLERLFLSRFLGSSLVLISPLARTIISSLVFCPMYIYKV